MPGAVRSPRRLGGLVALLFPCLLSPGAAQTFFERPLAPSSQSTEVLAQRRATIRKNARFLGWTFARQSHQDASKWVRQGPATGSFVRRRLSF
jgi:hypothetical protein